MGSFLNFLATYSIGIFVLFFCLAAAAFLIQWISWIFGWGRFSPENVAATTGVRKPLRQVMGELLFQDQSADRRKKWRDPRNRI